MSQYTSEILRSHQNAIASLTRSQLRVGDKVVKATGDYKYPGVVVAVFLTLNRQLRYVVEATGAEYAGMLHIFNASQLRKE